MSMRFYSTFNPFNSCIICNVIFLLHTRSAVVFVDLHLCVGGGGIVCSQPCFAQTKVRFHWFNAFKCIAQLHLLFVLL